jgi:hypothetical protein
VSHKTVEDFEYSSTSSSRGEKLACLTTTAKQAKGQT